MKITKNSDIIRDIENLYKLNGVNEFERINLFGIRNSADKKLSIWNDVIGMYDKLTGTAYLMAGTTDPSAWWTLNHKKGVDNLQIGYHQHLWIIGNHDGKLAFSQAGNKVSTIRDTNRNFQIDPSDEIITDRAWWGIDLHTTYRAVKTLGVIGKASAGCQVVKHWKEFHAVRDIAIGTGQVNFSYLLVDLDADSHKIYDEVYG